MKKENIMDWGDVHFFEPWVESVPENIRMDKWLESFGYDVIQKEIYDAETPECVKRNTPVVPGFKLVARFEDDGGDWWAVYVSPGTGPIADACDEGFYDGMIAVTNWISVDERLPGWSDFRRFDFLPILKDGRTFDKGYYSEPRGVWFDGNNDEVSNVTHWQPLPPPPEES